MEKQYTLDGLSVHVAMEEGLVRIDNDASLRRALVKQPEAATRLLVAGIKADHEAAFGTALAIRNDSFIVEIWGHLYFDHLLLKHRRILKIILAFGLYNRFMRSCAVIDCGERGKDPNRWLWDRLVPLRHMMGKRLASIRLPR